MSRPVSDFLTASDFYKFLQCPHWPYYDRFATESEQRLRREFTPGELQRLENNLLHEEEVVSRLYSGREIFKASLTADVVQDGEATRRLMEQGAEIIFQGTLTEGEWTGRPDVLERRDGQSCFGSWMYVPVEVKSSHAIEKYQKLQLLFYATLLERIQGTFPVPLMVMNRDGEHLSFSVEEMVAEFQMFVVELERIRRGEKPEPVFRKSCYDTGPWGLVCERYAKETNDIALLYNVNVEKLRALRNLGIRSVDDAARMDPVALDGVLKGLRRHGLEVMKAQAQTLQERCVIVREPVTLPRVELELYFDIESDPPNDADYLYGFLIRRLDESDAYKAFTTHRLEEEGEMWRVFLDWLATLPGEYAVYHFSPYEVTRLEVLEKRYGGSEHLEIFRSKMVDLKEIVNHAISFPLYFYGLKYIAPFLGFSWRGEVKGGSQSIDVFETYLETQDQSLFDGILVYNEDDVRATACVKDWLARYAQERARYSQPYPWVKS